jgi:hypothetical protein
MDTQVTAIALGDATRADAPKLTTPKSSAPAWKAIAPIATAVVLALAPAPPGLPHHAWYFFSIFVGVIVGLVLEPLPGAAIAIIGITVAAVLPICAVQFRAIVSAIGIEPNEKRIKEHLDNSLMLVTALNPHIGYEKAAKISLAAYREDISLREAALKLGFLTAEQFDSWVRPQDMTHPLGGSL